MGFQATYVHNLDEIDWTDERYHGPAHVTKCGITSHRVFDAETGETIAEINPKYRWYWSHGHLHVNPRAWMDYDHETDHPL